MQKKMENLRAMKLDELEKKLSELREGMRAARFKSEGSKPKNVREAWANRKEIARILTLITEQKHAR